MELSPEHINGEIVLTDSPFCEFFVVGTSKGFSFLDWRGGLYVFAEGEKVTGPLHSVGRQTIEILGSGDMSVMIEAVEVDALSVAQDAYFTRCKLSPETVVAVPRS